MERTREIRFIYGATGSELIFRGRDHVGRETSKVGSSTAIIIPALLASFPSSQASPSLPQWSEASIHLGFVNLGQLLQYLMSLVGCPLTSFSTFVYFLLKNHYLPEGGGMMPTLLVIVRGESDFYFCSPLQAPSENLCS